MKRALFLIVAALSFAGCSKGDEPSFDYDVNLIHGTWRVSHAWLNGGYLNVVGTIYEDVFKPTYITFNPDGSYSGEGEFGYGSGTYKASGKTIVTYIGGEEYARYDVLALSETTAEAEMYHKDTPADRLKFKVSKRGSEKVSVSTDPIFNRYCQRYDTDGDGVLSTQEAAAVTSITLDANSGIVSSLDGVEVFVNLETLECGGHGLTALDVSKNVNLERLYCPYNNLSALDVSKNHDLRYLHLFDNKLSNNTLRDILNALPVIEEEDYLGGNEGLIFFNTNQNGQTTNPFNEGEIHNLTSTKGWAHNSR